MGYMYKKGLKPKVRGKKLNNNHDWWLVRLKLKGEKEMAIFSSLSSFNLCASHLAWGKISYLRNYLKCMWCVSIKTLVLNAYIVLV
jgi:hypothetical protein